MANDEQGLPSEEGERPSGPHRNGADEKVREESVLRPNMLLING